MEELQSQLQGNERTLSLDSLEHVVVKYSSWPQDQEEDEEFYEEDGSGEIPHGGSFYLLPPIEEFSEPSTSGSSRSDQKLIERHFSSSCQNLATSTDFGLGLRSRCQTFPRSRMSLDAHLEESQILIRTGTLYPQEPRELDPDSFHQLHTADSSEELQEFLLLESQCMTNDTGLAHAFLPPGRLIIII